jgi:hypothetical protein
LSSERLAALDELEVLLRLLAEGEIVRARQQAAGCFASLERAFEVGAIVGDATLRRPVVRDARAAERLGERALATFLFDPSEALGRLRQELRALPDLVGAEPEDWERHPDRGRRAAFFAPDPTPDEVRASAGELGLETMELPCGLVHPAMLGLIASRLSLPPDELLRRVRGDARDDEEDLLLLGPRALANDLGDTEEICQAECFLDATCEQYVDLACRGDVSVFTACITKCEPPPFHCGSGEQIPANDRCDGIEHCTDASDEAGCPTFACSDGTSIPVDDQCDAFPDCTDGSDEVGCPGVPPPFDCGDGTQVPASYRCDGFDDCANGADEAGCPPEEPDPTEADCAALGVPRGP